MHFCSPFAILLMVVALLILFSFFPFDASIRGWIGKQGPEGWTRSYLFMIIIVLKKIVTIMNDMNSKENHNSAIAEVTSLLCQMNMKRKKLLIVKITMSKETNKPYEMLRLIFSLCGFLGEYIL